MEKPQNRTNHFQQKHLAWLFKALSLTPRVFPIKIHLSRATKHSTTAD